VKLPPYIAKPEELGKNAMPLITCNWKPEHGPLGLCRNAAWHQLSIAIIHHALSNIHKIPCRLEPALIGRGSEGKKGDVEKRTCSG
jgi:hypothetical protein